VLEFQHRKTQGAKRNEQRVSLSELFENWLFSDTDDPTPQKNYTPSSTL